MTFVKPCRSFNSCRRSLLLHSNQYRCSYRLASFWASRLNSPFLQCSHRHLSVESSSDASNKAGQETSSSLPRNRPVTVSSLPAQCPGCGASSIEAKENEAGHYSLTRPGVRRFLGLRTRQDARMASRKALFETAPQGKEQNMLKQDSANGDKGSQSKTASLPVCDRCHHLLHDNHGDPIYHPSLELLEETISQSPYRYNHIYHVVDAADFPMSLISNLAHRLHLPALRTKNRRAKHAQYKAGRVVDVSFIVTRSDLLAGQKEQVDAMMPLIREILRDALGSYGDRVRLGNVSCVSAHRGWWTRELKEKIRKRGGAGWMVGKVNVGKSNLFASVFPKGQHDHLPTPLIRQTSSQLRPQSFDDDNEILTEAERSEKYESYSPELPPPQHETEYPVMPVVSALAGTTASPIRVPFGNGKGELVDLPGLKRGGLESYVRPDLRQKLLMTSRISAKRYVLKMQRSLLLGSLIRITPTNPNEIIMVHPFTNLPPHLSSWINAQLFQRGGRMTGVPDCTAESASKVMASAGKIKLKWDVTKQYGGVMTARPFRSKYGREPPFVVFGADILIEGYGWVEVITQVRRRAWREAMLALRQKYLEEVATTEEPLELEAWKGKKKRARLGDFNEEVWPEVEVFSPHGKFIQSRRPLCAFLLTRNNPAWKEPLKTRPRMSMTSVKARRALGTPTGVSSKADRASKSVSSTEAP